MYVGRHRAPRWTPSVSAILTGTLASVALLLAAVPGPGQWHHKATLDVVMPHHDGSATLADANPPVPYLGAFGFDIGVVGITERTLSMAWDATHAHVIPYVQGPDGTLHMRCSVVEGDDYSTAYCADGTEWPS